MERITVYSNKDCAKCARTVRFQMYLNWLRRVRYSTDEPKCGPLRLGEIAVEDLRTGTISKGVEAVRQIYWQLPALWPLLPLLRIPAMARRVDEAVRGCEDGSCSLPGTNAVETRDAQPVAHDPPGIQKRTRVRTHENRPDPVFALAAETTRRASEVLPPLDTDNRLLRAMDRGLPPCAGNAVGFDRVIMMLLGFERIDDVVPFPFERA